MQKITVAGHDRDRSACHFTASSLVIPRSASRIKVVLGAIKRIERREAQGGDRKSK
jgi:hypothetical protein